MVGSSVLGLWALAWLTRIPPLPDCKNITRLSSDSDRLLCAEAQMQSATEPELVAAIQLIANWPTSHPLYEEALPVLTEASDRLLEKATDEMHAGNLAQAVDLASQIPLETPLRQEAQAAIWNWRQEWKQAEAIEQQVQQAIQAQNWDQAQDQLQRFKGLTSDYWLETRFNQLKTVIQRERTAWARINQARTLADSGNPAQLGQALTLAQKVDLNSHAWSVAKEDIDRWSQRLLLYSFRRWELGDVDGAIAAVQKVPPDPDMAPEAQDLIRFSHAKRLAAQAQEMAPSYGQLFYLIEAIYAAAAIAPSSPFHSAAQNALASWQAQLDDLQTLQTAHLIASLRQPWAFQQAVQVAQQVALERPRRVQAQTLIAHWRDQIERIEDRPYLLRAERLAQKETIPALRAAIAEARQVALGRALRIDAQTKIAAWQDQIEIIEDQPILNQANALAANDQLEEAIEVAEQIAPNRALYDQAQTMVADWTRTIQIREDRPILAEAKSRAFEGYLTEAINLAAQIAPGRALYDEAQNAIALWQAERAYIRSLREDAAASDNDDAAEVTDNDNPRQSPPAERSDNTFDSP